MPPRSNRKAAQVFQFGMKRIMKAHQDNTDEFIRRLFTVVATNVVEGGAYGPGTPVDTGFARASWRIGLNRASGVPNSAPGMVQYVLAGARAGDKLVLMNPVPYIRRLEYGHSAQAPQGMVRVVFLKLPIIAKAVSAGMPKK